jgi:hypothetical protein
MSTTERSVRAWIPAVVTTLLAVVLVAGCALLWEVLEDQDVTALHDPESPLGVFALAPLAPLGGPGIVGPGDFSDSAAQLGGGLVAVAVVVFLLTWLSARSGSALSTLFGAWLGTVLGVGLGALVAFEIFVRRNDLSGASAGLHQARLTHLETGLYWGVVAGLLLGLVAMAVRAMATRSRSIVDPDEPAAPWPPPAREQDPADTTAFAPPSTSAKASTDTPDETTAETPPEHRAP